MKPFQRFSAIFFAYLIPKDILVLSSIYSSSFAFMYCNGFFYSVFILYYLLSLLLSL